MKKPTPKARKKPRRFWIVFDEGEGVAVFEDEDTALECLNDGCPYCEHCNSKEVLEVVEVKDKKKRKK